MQHIASSTDDVRPATPSETDTESDAPLLNVPSASSTPEMQFAGLTSKIPSTPAELTMFEAANDMDGIVAALRAHQALDGIYKMKHGIQLGGFPFPSVEPKVWVKYATNHEDLERQAALQQMVYEKLKKTPGIRIPRVLRFYTLPGSPYDGPYRPIETYPCGVFVMEYIPAPLFVEAINKAAQKDKATPIDGVEQMRHVAAFDSRIADALVAMALISPDADQKPAPPGGGRIDFEAWGERDIYESTAPKDYDSVQDLADSINETIRTVLPDTSAKADFSNEPLILCYSDIHDANFFIDDISDPESTITIIDFDVMNWLPISFLFWLLQTNRSYRFVREAVHAKLPEIKPNEENVRALNYFSTVQWTQPRELLCAESDVVGEDLVKKGLDKIAAREEESKAVSL